MKNKISRKLVVGLSCLMLCSISGLEGCESKQVDKGLETENLEMQISTDNVDEATVPKQVEEQQPV